MTSAARYVRQMLLWFHEMMIIIDHIPIEVPEGTTVLRAAEMLGIAIPTLCYMEKSDCHSSCMVCLVRDVMSGKLFPSCAMPVAEGMQIQTHSTEIREMRRQALELLLGDHVGDCEAPCRLSCPAFMNIPLMNRLIAGGHFSHALEIVREEIALPLVLGFICPAPCEKACHRKSIDQPVSICMLKRFTADASATGAYPLPSCLPENNTAVAVIGSGPAGLSAAFFLRRMGYRITVFEKSALPGGALRYAIPEAQLPVGALEAELNILVGMGIQFITQAEIDRERFEKEIVPAFSAIILATGSVTEHDPVGFGLTPDPQGNLINRKTGATSRPGIFGCGSLIKDQNMAVRSAAQGRIAALEADLFLNTGKTLRPRFRFNSSISHLLPGEEKEYMKESVLRERSEPVKGWRAGFTPEEAILEAARCLHCDCRKQVTCQLRILADDYQANRKRFMGPERKPLTKLTRHNLLIYEPEKCIRCGRCVAITKANGEEAGMTFIGRGFDIRINVPLGGELHEGIKKSAFFCVEGCPTGALSFKDQEEGVEYGKRFRMTDNGWKIIQP